MLSAIGPTSTAVYIGDWYEWDGSNGTSYYYLAGQRVAMRTAQGLRFLHSAADPRRNARLSPPSQSGTIAPVSRHRQPGS